MHSSVVCNNFKYLTTQYEPVIRCERVKLALHLFIYNRTYLCSAFLNALTMLPLVSHYNQIDAPRHRKKSLINIIDIKHL